MTFTLQDFKSSYNTYIYFFLLIVLAIALPLSVYLMSLTQILLSINWIIEGKFKKKFQILKTRESILLVVSIFIVHLIWLIPSQDLKFGLNDLRIKIPILALPIIIGTSESLSLKNLKIILLFFIAATTLGTIISTFVFLGFTKYVITDYREISIYISHIRFALLINLAIFFQVYFLISKEYIVTKLEKILYPIIIIWLIGFLFILHSNTGLVVLIVTSYILIFYLAVSLRKTSLRIFLVILLILLPVSIITYVTKAISKFYTIENVDFNKLPKFTSKGNKYFHDKKYLLVENGHYIDLYKCNKELREEWNKLSDYSFDGKDLLGQNLRQTLVRYLTSLGFTKDADGVKKLSHDDIKAIEDGCSNYIFNNKYAIYPIVYKMIWEIDVYNKTKEADAHTLTQRIEFLKTGKQIINDNFWMGVGTGDLQIKFNEYYHKLGSRLSMDWRLRAHNQFVTFFIAFGILGFLWIIFAMIYPVFIEKKYNNYFFMVFFIIALLSMFNEDTLETQAGISFFAYFYCLFLLGNKTDSINS